MQLGNRLFAHILVTFLFTSNTRFQDRPTRFYGTFAFSEVFLTTYNSSAPNSGLKSNFSWGHSKDELEMFLGGERFAGNLEIRKHGTLEGTFLWNRNNWQTISTSAGEEVRFEMQMFTWETAAILVRIVCIWRTGGEAPEDNNNNNNNNNNILLFCSSRNIEC